VAEVATGLSSARYAVAQAGTLASAMGVKGLEYLCWQHRSVFAATEQAQLTARHAADATVQANSRPPCQENANGVVVVAARPAHAGNVMGQATSL